MMTMTKKVMTLRVKMIMKRKNKKNNVEENIGIGWCQRGWSGDDRNVEEGDDNNEADDYNKNNMKMTMSKKKDK